MPVRAPSGHIKIVGIFFFGLLNLIKSINMLFSSGLFINLSIEIFGDIILIFSEE